MTHVLDQAKILLEDVRKLRRETGATRTASTILLLPVIEHTLVELIECVEHLTQREERRSAFAEFSDARDQLLLQVAALNKELQKITNYDQNAWTNTGPFARGSKRVLTAVTRLEELLQLPDDC